MAVGGIFGFLSGKSSGGRAPASELAENPAGLAGLFSRPINMPAATVDALGKDLQRGLALYSSVWDTRLQLAMAAFDHEMRSALFEILFLLHVNHPSMAEWQFDSARFEGAQGARQKAPVPMTADLYVEGAPHGVKGIGSLPAGLLEPLTAYVNKTFGMTLNTNGNSPHAIVSISSGGSVGTIGHKSGASDLDLNIQYDLASFVFDTSKWTDETFSEAMAAEKIYWVERARRAQNIMPEALSDPSVSQGLTNYATKQLTKAYPNLWRHYSKAYPITAEVLWSEEGREQRSQVMAELMLLMKRAAGVVGRAATRKQEALLKERINRIQDYIEKKFPSAEIYLFPTSNEDFRQGRHASTLETKESPGSAYELLLNYETVLPGIQFTSQVPTHFILSQALNSHPSRYGRFMDYIRFGLVDVYSGHREKFVDLGATPDLTPEYVAKHHGAVYWEAFKASSGNLPKATLNLLRYEMLLDPRFSKSSVQLLKAPDTLNELIPPPPQNHRAELEAMARDEAGLPNWTLPKMETDFPNLRVDPWWLRYKALKIAYGKDNCVQGLPPEEQRRVSKIIDLAFALHVRISDVFTKPGDTRPLDSERERVLLQFNAQAFPEQSPRRTFLEHMFAGEVRAINYFEQELRDLFKACLKRVEGKITVLNTSGEKPSAEFEIWHHYYQQNFEPAPNVIQRSIMSHLKVARGRIQAGFTPRQGWVFRSFQRESSVGKRFDTFGTMNHLPDEVVLHENPSFLSGLAHCILNGYYGTINRSTLNERRTALEFDATAVDMGHEVHNTQAFVRPDQVERIMERMHGVFPYQHYDYLDCIRLKREITEVFVFLNLLIFGRLSLLYRDNMQTWYCNEYDHPEMVARSQEFTASANELMTAAPIRKSLGKFFSSRSINPRKIRLAAWVNPNSVKTEHGRSQHLQKEEDLAKMMLRQILLEHGAPKPKARPAALEAPQDGQTAAERGQWASVSQDHQIGATDWRGRYEALMEQLGINIFVPGEKGRRKHPKFRPKAGGKDLQVKSGDVSGKLIALSADALSFSANDLLPLGKEMFAEIEGKVIVRIRVVGCREQKAGGNGGDPFRVDSWITNEEQGYRCFVLLAPEFSGQQA